MSREDPPLRIRLPADLKAAIKSRAATNRRSMNAEIVACLDQSIQGDANSLLADVLVETRITKLSIDVETLRNEVRALDEKLTQDRTLVDTKIAKAGMEIRR